MIEDAITKIQTMAEQHIKPQFISNPGDPPHIRYLSQAGKNLERRDAQPGYRTIQVYSLNDLIQLGTDHFDRRTASDGRMACFVGTDQVILVFDAENGREYARYGLIESEEHGWFKAKQKDPKISVLAFREALQVKLREAFTDERLIEQVSSLSVNNEVIDQVGIGRTKESLGRVKESTVNNVDELPNELQTFGVRMYANPGLAMRFPVRCLVDPDQANGQWVVRPLAYDLKTLWMNTALVIKNRLEVGFAPEEVDPDDDGPTLVKRKIPVFLGDYTIDQNRGG